MIIAEPTTNKGTAKPIEYEIDDKGCWVCISHTSGRPNSYARVRRNNKIWKAHRYVFTLVHGDIPPGKILMHSCDNQQCINLDHLSVGTQYDNVRDMINKGRGLRGEKNSQCRLSDHDVNEILNSPLNNCQLARKFGVSRGAIQYIRRGHRGGN